PRFLVSEKAQCFAELDAFQSKQLALDRQAAAVTGKAAVRADHAVTGNDHGNGIAAVRKAHGSHGIGIAEPARDLGITCRTTIGNFAQRLPHALLERRAPRCKRQIEVTPLTVKILLQLAYDIVEALGPLLAIRGKAR